MRNDTGGVVDADFFGSRTSIAARGFGGGNPGSLRLLSLDGQPASPKSRINFKPGSIIELQEAGGGGFGDPYKRAVSHVERDLNAGLVTERYLRSHYPQQFLALELGEGKKSPL
ncbi:MAG: hypothetical protein AB7K64_10470 [Variibacter sp.]